MNRINLSSDLGALFLGIVYCVLVGMLGLLIYSIVNNRSGIILSLIFSVFWYLVFYRKARKIQSVTFDEDYFYTKKGDKIKFSDIEKIENSKIICKVDGVKKVIYSNPFYPGKNHKLFYKYFISKKA